jgi:outer membrane lipoprotein-sorting protein
MKIFLVLLTALVTCTSAQSNDADKILTKVKQGFEKVHDYKVEVSVTLDIDFLKAPVSNATIYFKQPDKVKIHSEGFAMLPKEGINFSPASLLKGDYTSIYENDVTLNGRETAVIKTIPLGNDKEILISTLWIDKESYLIHKVESTTKTAGTFSIEFTYDVNKTKYPLPSSMLFSFETDRVIPKDKGEKKENTKQVNKKKKLSKGTVKIVYSNYKVNTGLPDSIFEEEKEKSK